MSLPTLRPNATQQSPIKLPTPPTTSSPYKPLRDGPPEQSPPTLIPMREYDDAPRVEWQAVTQSVAMDAARSSAGNSAACAWLRLLLRYAPTRLSGKPLKGIAYHTRTGPTLVTVRNVLSNFKIPGVLRTYGCPDRLPPNHRVSRRVRFELTRRPMFLHQQALGSVIGTLEDLKEHGYGSPVIAFPC